VYLPESGCLEGVAYLHFSNRFVSPTCNIFFFFLVLLWKQFLFLVFDHIIGLEQTLEGIDKMEAKG
jgi:hypothetical protein